MTAFWAQGTITLTTNSATVTGQGTAFLSSLLRPGDTIESDDGRRATIATVNGDTAITLDKPWRGAGQTAAPYKAWYTPDDVFIEGKVRQALSLAASPNLMAEAALDGTGGNLLSYFTGNGTKDTTPLTPFARTLLDDANAAAMRQTLELVKQLSLGDATAGRLLTTGAFGLGNPGNMTVVDWSEINDFAALPTGFYRVSGGDSGGVVPSGSYVLLVIRVTTTNVYQRLSGINVSNHSYERYISSTTPDRPWRMIYNQGNILGTVSQSAGAPTGAIIESGNNANGYYEKYADGGMSCWFFDTTPRVCTNPAALPFYSSAAFNLTFPAAFIGKPSLFYSAHRDVSGASGFVFPLFGSAPFTTSTYARMSIGGLSDGATGGVCYLARGRWF